MLEIDEKKLIETIKHAFADVVYPGDDNVVYDNSDKYYDVVETKANFVGKHWKELSIETMTYHKDSFVFLTTAAFHFYLPALMIASITDSEVVDVLSENVISYLTPPDSTKDDGSDYSNYVKSTFNAIFSLLTVQQREVVATFIEWNYYREHEEFRFIYQERKDAIEFWKANSR